MKKIIFIIHENLQNFLLDFFLFFILKIFFIKNFCSFFYEIKIKHLNSNRINILFQGKGVFNEEIIFLFDKFENVNLYRLNRNLLAAYMDSSGNRLVFKLNESSATWKRILFKTKVSFNYEG